MEITFSNSDDKDYQKLLNNLLKDIFLDFQFWYDLGMWTEDYESYSIIEDGQMLSNICVYKTKIIYRGREYSALSIGAVATRKGYRKAGYAGQLMEHIINKYEGTPMYLSANESVVDFYPKFGCKRIYEKLPILQCRIENIIQANKLVYNDKTVSDYVNNRINFSSSLDCTNSMNINIFHIHLGYLHDCIYELEEISTMIVAKQTGNLLKLIAVYSKEPVTFAEFISHLPFNGIEKIEFGFMPHWDDCDYRMVDYEHDPIFVKNINCDLGDFKFPELSIT